MGEVDTERQALNVARMQLLGAEVVPVKTGSPHAQGRDQRGDARLGRQRRPHRTTCFGTAAGPHPFPAMVRDFCRGIGDEARRPVPRADRRAARRRGRLRRRRLQRDRAVPRASSTTPTCGCSASRPAATASTPARHAATINAGEVGVLHGARTYVLQDEDGQTIESHSISAGLDYPGVGPEHAWLAETGRATYRPVTDAEAMDAFALLVPHRGHHPGDRVRARARRRAASWPRSGPGATILVNLSGRGDKDMDTAIEWFGLGETAARRRPTGEAARHDRRPPTAFAAAKAEGRGALVGYLPGRLPRPSTASIAGDARRWSRPAATSSRSACPTPTR